MVNFTLKGLPSLTYNKRKQMNQTESKLEVEEVYDRHTGTRSGN